MAKSSTTRKVTKVARTGGGRTKRAGQATLWLFPSFIVAVVVVGLGLTVVVSRQQRQPDTTSPRVGADHWHSAIGFDLCGTFVAPVVDNGQDPLGIHTHGDSIIHTHPFSSTAAGKNARLQIWLDTVGVNVTADKIELPDAKMSNGDKCGDKAGRVVTKVWETRAPGDQGRIVEGDPGVIKLGNNQLITVAFLPEGDDNIPKPPSEPNLDRLSDVGPTATPTTLPGEVTTSIAPTTTPPTSAAP